MLTLPFPVCIRMRSFFRCLWARGFDLTRLEDADGNCVGCDSTNDNDALSAFDHSKFVPIGPSSVGGRPADEPIIEAATPARADNIAGTAEGSSQLVERGVAKILSARFAVRNRGRVQIFQLRRRTATTATATPHGAAGGVGDSAGGGSESARL